MEYYIGVYDLSMGLYIAKPYSYLEFLDLPLWAELSTEEISDSTVLPPIDTPPTLLSLDLPIDHLFIWTVSYPIRRAGRQAPGTQISPLPRSYLSSRRDLTPPGDAR